MPNTKSAERRMRNSATKHVRNRSAKSRLHTLEKSYLEILSAGKADEAATAFRTISSAFDKAAKAGTIHRATANRKKSRLAVRLVRLKPAAAPAAPAQPAPQPASQPPSQPAA
ncbi:MAG: 30S ribosomal protein S20 [Limisphaerales bacterium]